MGRLSSIETYPKDRITSALEFINTDHAYIHHGIAYKAHLYIGDLSAAASESYSLKWG